MKRVLIAGYTGAMGQKAVDLVAGMPDFEVAAGLAPSGKQGNLPAQAKIYRKLSEINESYDIWVDFTTPQAVFENVQFALQHHMRPIVGTTGLTDEQVQLLQKLAQTEGVGGLIAPNFGMSAVLLMKFAQLAAEFFPDAEIIEMHHADKKDAPSGTALATAKLIAQARQNSPESANSEETLAGVRGGDYQGVKIHAVRLPGYIAHEQVLFGGPGEALTIRQDSFDRSSFMSGVKVALLKVAELDHLVVGLENIL
ncbi:4-hydroxy-tetrahydrodipicolinate reductase [Lactobacillus corticis]|uniref:4-hydroxy-tetrahydrodipicolinate reductase n=2 Tax=Lactobacillus corticis TaxID=2201249 RepID=A0A916QHB2_9LACO|nr:4-hydroxy-tetrahydrodipicolinate reductase [Lactobacillus corticis]